jgi:hypothetical protein
MRSLLMYFQLLNLRCPCSIFDPQTYNKVVGNPLWKATMQKEYDSLLENQTWIWFHFHQKGIFSGADGSTGSRGTRLDRFPKDFIRSINISTSS